MKIRFGTTEYVLAYDHVNASQYHLQVDIVKGESTIDDILSHVVGVNEITVIDDAGEVAGIYRGYTELNAITTYDGENVSVELLNKTVEDQVAALERAMVAMQARQNEQGDRIDQVTEATSALIDSQATQDLAIEDLGEVVSELMPE